MDTPILCRITAGDNKIEFESVDSTGLTIAQTVEDDKRYGVMVPANGEYFMWTVLNEDEEFTQKQVEKSIAYSIKRWTLYANIPKFKRVKKDFKGIIDFRLEFRTVDTDPDKQLRNNTIMYHYYPIQDVNHPLRGLCVVNKAFFFTSHGNGVYGTEFQKYGIPVQFPNHKYDTMDFDQLHSHELGHGLGLPHDPEPQNIMSTNEGIMAEYPSERDIIRIQSKYGYRGYVSSIFKRWFNWLQSASER